MSQTSVTATRWVCDWFDPKEPSNAALYCKSVALAPEGERPAGWRPLGAGRDLCPGCAGRAEHETFYAQRRAATLAFAQALTDAGLPAAPMKGYEIDRVTADVDGVAVVIQREGDKVVRWRARGDLPAHVKLNSASPDAARLASTIRREVERAKARERELAALREKSPVKAIKVEPGITAFVISPDKFKP